MTTNQAAMAAAELLPMFAVQAKERQGARTDLVANLPPSEESGKARDEAANPVTQQVPH